MFSFYNILHVRMGVAISGVYSLITALSMEHLSLYLIGIRQVPSIRYNRGQSTANESNMATFTERLAIQAATVAHTYSPRARGIAKEALLVRRKAGAWDQLTTVSKSFR